MQITLDKKDAKALVELNELFSQADSVFSCMSPEGRDMCLDAFSGEFSLNHVIQSGLKASEELIDSARLFPRNARSIEIEDIGDGRALEKVRDIFQKAYYVFAGMTQESMGKMYRAHEPNNSLNHAVLWGREASEELVNGVHRKFIRESLKNDLALKEIPKGELLQNGWMEADGRTKDYFPGAAYMRSIGGGGTPFATYMFTIVESDSGNWVPVHGSIKMPGVETPEKAAYGLMQYWHELPNESKFRFDVGSEIRDYFAKEIVAMPENKNVAALDWKKKMKALDVLRSFPGQALVSDLYDNDKEFAEAINDVFGDSFEYPDFSHRSVASVVKMAAKEVAKSLPAAQELTFSEFSQFATAVKLENHGRQWEVFYGKDSMGFADGPSVEAALKMAHFGAVNNAIYANSPEAPDFMNGTQVFPPENVVAEYPHLKERFADVFAERVETVDRPPLNFCDDVLDFAEVESQRHENQSAHNRYALVAKDADAGLVWSVGNEWSASLLDKTPALMTGQQADALLKRHPKASIVDVIVFREAVKAYNAGFNSVIDHNERSTPETRQAAREAGIKALVRAGFSKDALDVAKTVSAIETPLLAPSFSLGQRFDFKQGDQVVANGYRGTVSRTLDGELAGMAEVRLPGGVSCMSASFPDCFPAVTNGVEVVTEGRFVGAVKEVSGQFVVQDAGRGRLVAHECYRFDGLPAVGDLIDLQHRGGKVVFAVEKEKGKGTER